MSNQSSITTHWTLTAIWNSTDGQLEGHSPTSWIEQETLVDHGDRGVARVSVITTSAKRPSSPLFGKWLDFGDAGGFWMHEDDPKRILIFNHDDVVLADLNDDGSWTGRFAWRLDSIERVDQVQ